MTATDTNIIHKQVQIRHRPKADANFLYLAWVASCWSAVERKSRSLKTCRRHVFQQSLPVSAGNLPPRRLAAKGKLSKSPQDFDPHESILVHLCRFINGNRKESLAYAKDLFGGRGWIRTIEAYATDLQSAPFGHSGTRPYGADNRT